VSEPLFVRGRGTSLSIELPPAEAQYLKKIARSKGLKEAAVLREWILERLHEFSSIRRAPNKASPATAQKPDGG